MQACSAWAVETFDESLIFDRSYHGVHLARKLFSHGVLVLCVVLLSVENRRC